jgi:hypothetical protein
MSSKSKEQQQPDSTGWTVTVKPKYTVMLQNEAVDINKGAVDTLLGFDFVDPGQSIFQFGKSGLLNNAEITPIQNRIFDLFKITGTTDQANLQRSVVIMSILEKFADDGTSPDATYEGTITLGTTDIDFATVARHIGAMRRRFARYYGQFFYEYQKYHNKNPRSFGWGLKWGIKPINYFLGADFLDKVQFETDLEHNIYAEASKRAKNNAKGQQAMRSGFGGGSGELQITDQNFRN